MEAAFSPKCLGTWHFHKHTHKDDIKAFVMFSSMSSGAGAEDLHNYAAANAYLEELSQLRRSLGLNSVAIQFPEVEEAGMAADLVGAGGAATCSLGVVQQVIKQIICGVGSMTAYVALMPRGYLIPRTPTWDSNLDLLRERVNK